jgi:hypothetical protein
VAVVRRGSLGLWPAVPPFKKQGEPALLIMIVFFVALAALVTGVI